MAARRSKLLTSTPRLIHPVAVRAHLAQACRDDFLSFIKKVFHFLSPGAPFHMNAHILALAYELELVRQGELRRLIVTMPPRMGKSIIGSVAFPAFISGHEPSKRIIAVSYASDLAIKLSNDYRDVVKSPWYQDAFPDMRLSRGKNTEHEVVTTRRGYRLATSIDGTLTGRGGDIIIVDDPLKPIDAFSDAKRERVNNFFYNTLLSRLDDKRKGAIIILMQRLHPDDLVGTLLRTSNEWKELSFPAIADCDENIQIGKNKFFMRKRGDLLDPQRDSLEALQELRKHKPEVFAAQFQQSPMPPGGAMVKPSWIGRYTELPARTSASACIQSWDTALKVGDQNSFSACTTLLLHEKKYYLADVVHDRFDYPTLRGRALELARQYNPRVILIEDSGVGTALIKELQNAGLPAIPIKPERDKRTRMSVQTDKIASGLFFLPHRAPWLDEFEAEFFIFPGSRYTDQVDSIAQALAYEIPASGWSNRSNEGLRELGERLAFNRFFGAVTGRPR